MEKPSEIFFSQSTASKNKLDYAGVMPSNWKVWPFSFDLGPIQPAHPFSQNSCSTGIHRTEEELVMADVDADMDVSHASSSNSSSSTSAGNDSLSSYNLPPSLPRNPQV